MLKIKIKFYKLIVNVTTIKHKLCGVCIWGGGYVGIASLLGISLSLFEKYMINFGGISQLFYKYSFPLSELDSPLNMVSINRQI